MMIEEGARATAVNGDVPFTEYATFISMPRVEVLFAHHGMAMLAIFELKMMRR